MFSKLVLFLLLIVLPKVGHLSLSECRSNDTSISVNRFYYNYNNNGLINQIIERHYAQISLKSSHPNLFKYKRHKDKDKVCEDCKDCSDNASSSSSSKSSACSEHDARGTWPLESDARGVMANHDRKAPRKALRRVCEDCNDVNCKIDRKCINSRRFGRQSPHDS